MALTTSILLLDLRRRLSGSTLTWWKLCITHLKDVVGERWDPSLILTLNWHRVVEKCNRLRRRNRNCSLVNLHSATTLPLSLNTRTFLHRTSSPRMFLELSTLLVHVEAAVRHILLWSTDYLLSWSQLARWLFAGRPLRELRQHLFLGVWRTLRHGIGCLRLTGGDSRQCHRIERLGLSSLDDSTSTWWFRLLHLRLRGWSHLLGNFLRVTIWVFIEFEVVHQNCFTFTKSFINLIVEILSL